MTLPHGRVFTPAELANTLWRAIAETLTASTPRREAPWVVAEPAAGPGALLRAALSDDRVGRVYGVELNRADMLCWPNDPRLCAAHADALTLVDRAAPASTSGDEHQALAPAQLRGKQTTLLADGWADAVIANPPYVRETGNASLFRELRAWNDAYWRPFYRKDADLHHFFWALAVRWLRPGGVLGFLTPAYVLESAAATPIRRLLAQEGEVLGLWRAGHDRTFNAGVEAAITLWQKRPAHATLEPSTSAVVARQAPRLNADLTRRDGAVLIEPDGQPWWWFDPVRASRQAPVEESLVRIGDIFRVVEGVSTGANRTAANAGGSRGIFVLTDTELTALGLAPDTHKRFVRQRWRTTKGPTQWLLVVPDHSLPCLDNEHPAATGPHRALAAHLLRHAPQLRGRAEMRRNPRRSWYATAWLRGDSSTRGPTLCTPKWSKEPAFSLVPPSQVVMTDHRQLLPRVAMTESERRRWCDHLNQQGHHFARRLKRKGDLLEFYGDALAALRIPPPA